VGRPRTVLEDSEYTEDLERERMSMKFYDKPGTKNYWCEHAEYGEYWSRRGLVTMRIPETPNRDKDYTFSDYAVYFCLVCGKVRPGVK